MKSFLLKIVLFLVLVVIIFSVLNYMGDEGLKQSKNFIYRRWTAIAQPIDADILLMGNSRMAYHVNPMIMDSLLHVNSYNLGIFGGAYEMSEVAWNLYEKHSKKTPRLIVYNVDYTYFTNQPIPFMPRGYIPFYTDILFSPIIDQFELPWLWKHLPLIKYASKGELFTEGLCSFLREESSPTGLFYKGFIFRGNSRYNGEWLPFITNFKRDEERIRKFCQFLETCRIRKIPVILLKSPILPSLVQDLTGFDDSIALIDSLSISQNLLMLDYTDFSLDTMLFGDRFHLNGRGANLFTVQLCHDLDSLIRGGQISL